MAGTLDYNANLDVKGNIKLKDTPNQTGSVLLKGTGTSIISTRTNAQFISDLNLALKNDSRFHEHSNKSVLDGITSTKVSNWDTAFGWGDFRDYGLGRGNIYSNDLNDIPKNSIVYLSTASTNRPDNVLGSVISLGGTSDPYSDFQLLGGYSTPEGSLYFRKNRDNIWSSWVTVWDNNNLTKLSQLTNDLGFVTTDTKYTAGTGLSLTGTTFANTAPNAKHTGDVTGATALTIANSAVTHAKYQNIATQRILGRGATGTGNVQELTLGSNLTLSTAGVLSATNTNTTYTGSNGISVTGTVISPTYGTTAGTIAQGNDARMNNGQTAFGWGNHAGLYAPVGRTITINGVTQNLSTNRTWTIPVPSITNLVPYTGANQHVNLNAKRLSNVSILDIVLNSMTYPNATNSTVDAWNQTTKNYFSVSSGNNRLAIIGESTENRRRFGLQVGHTAPTYANASGVLELQPLHGEVRIGSLSGSGVRMVVADNTGVVSSQAIPSIPDVSVFWDIKTNTGYAIFPSNNIDLATAGTIGLATSAYGGLAVPATQSDIVTKSQHGSADLLQISFPFRDNNYFGFRNKSSSGWHPWREVYHSGNFATGTTSQYIRGDGSLATYANTTYTAGNGLALSNTNVFSVAGGNGLVANASGLSLGTPSSVTLASTNSLTSTSHTHAFLPGGTASQYIDGTGKLATFPTIPDESSFVKKVGDTMTGELIIDARTGGGFTRVFDIASGGWARAGLAIKNKLNEDPLQDFGVYLYGSGLISTYAYIGFNGYDAINNLRIYKDRVAWGNDTLATEKWVNAQGFVKTDTKYTAGAGLTLSGTTFSLPVTQSGSGNYVSSVVQTTGGITVTKATLPIPALVTSTTATGTTNVATTNTNTYLNVVSGGVATGSSTKVVGAGSVTVASNTSGQLTITGTNTTYSNMSLAELTTGTVTTGRVISAKTINDYMASFSGGVFEKTSEGGLRVKDWNSTANYGGAIAIGPGTSALRPNALAMMAGSSANGISSLSIGVNGQAIGTRSISIGPYSTSFATDSHNFGLGLINNQMGLTIIGRYNDPVIREVTNEIKDESLLFVIGNGRDSMLKSNSLEHFQDGSTKYFGRQYYNSATRKEEWFQEDNTLVDVAYLKANGSGLTPNPEALPFEAYSGDVLEGQTSNADKPGEIVYYKEDGTWAYISSGGSTLNTTRYAVTYGVWLGNGKVLLRGYFKTGKIGTLYRGRVLIIRSQSNPTDIVVKQDSMTTNDVYLGTIIGTQGVLFFNPK